MSDPIVAAVDIGTNSTKLLVSGPGLRHFETIDTRLGEHVGRQHRFEDAAIGRTLATLRAYRQAADRFGVSRLAAVATSATRDAQNRDVFLDAATEELGTRPVVLSGADEGRLAFRGALSNLPAVERPIVVLDIGGGSTEFVLGSDDVHGVCSVDVGCVRLSESELRSDPPRADELSNAIGRVQDHLDDVLREIPGIADAASFVGIGGTITTAAAVELGAMDLERIHGFELTRGAAEDVFRTLATESLADRLHNPGLPAGRAPVIVGGLCVLVAVMRRLKLDSLVVSTRTLVDGVCQHLSTGAPWPPDPSKAGGAA
jgi:exopolyphosphatase/guanosine-5'-triphosphate,3'-diphosphate pyrophosphatase